jgi:hypothetical protein
MSNDHQALSGLDVTNGISADAHGFMSVYRPVEKDKVIYGSETWVHMHDAWLLWERHGMVSMLLTRCTVCICWY